MIKIAPRSYDKKTTMEIFDIMADGFEHAVGWVEQKEAYIPTVHITHPKYELDKVALGKALKKKWGMNGDYFLVTETVFLRDEIAKARCLADKQMEESKRK